MKKLKISKKFYANQPVLNEKCYLIFTFFNINPTMFELLRMIIEDDFSIKISKIKYKYNSIDIFLEIDLKNYIENKLDLCDFFSDENFKFNLVGVYYKNNYLQVSFFENDFLYELDSYEIFDEIFYFIYLDFINKIIEKKKIIFFFYSTILLTQALFRYNVYNTSSSF